MLQIACPSDCMQKCKLLIRMQVAYTDATRVLVVLLTSWVCCPLGLTVFVNVTVFRVDGMVVACVGALMCVFLCCRQFRPIHSHIHSHMVAACLRPFMIQIAVLANTLLRMLALAACLRAFMVQIAVLANHENGRDSHIRQIKIFGPRLDPTGDTLPERDTP